MGGLIIRQKEPANLETPFGDAGSFLTSGDLFYLRNHFPTPALDAASYRLYVDGAVKRPLCLTYDDLRAMPNETRPAVLECAGNSRVFLVPPVPGVQWGLGAVGNAEWTGVPLAALLARAGVDDGACEVVLEGADRGRPSEEPLPPAPLAYARSMTIAKALNGEVLLAYRMNGRELSPDHGFPVRAIVPGHYGMASVKWLTRITPVREPFEGYWQTSEYAYWVNVDGKPVRRPLGEMKVKSEIARPRVYETLPPCQPYLISGAAWTGETVVTRVEVSVDGGQRWCDARFIDAARIYAWRRWTMEWTTPVEPGRYVLMSRATDANGAVQPDRHDSQHGTYAIHHSLPIEVFVGDPAHASESGASIRDRAGD